MNSSSNPSLLRALSLRGWCFRVPNEIEEMITAQLSSGGGFCTVDSIESELLNMDLRSIGGNSLPEPSALCKASHIRGPWSFRLYSLHNVVLWPKTFFRGPYVYLGLSFPLPSLLGPPGSLGLSAPLLRLFTWLYSLQLTELRCDVKVSSCRDITRSSIGEVSGNSGHRRLLLLKLTDGHSEANAVELSHVPSLREDVIPGTKGFLGHPQTRRARDWLGKMEAPIRLKQTKI